MPVPTRVFELYKGNRDEKTDLKCAVVGQNLIVITTDEGIDGYGEIETLKPYIKPQVLFYRDLKAIKGKA